MQSGHWGWTGFTSWLEQRRQWGLAVAILLVGLWLPGAAQAACTINLTLPANTADAPSAILADAWDDGCRSAANAGLAGPVVPGYFPVNGTVDFANRRYTTQFRYTPQLNFVGTDSFRLSGDQPSGNGAGIIIVNVTVTARAPVTSSAAATVAYNSSANVMPLSFTGVAHTAVQVVASPTHGTTSVSGTSILYTPTPGFAGADSFTYRGSNGGGQSNVSTISITVMTPPAPVAGAYTAPATAYDAAGGSQVNFSVATQATNGPSGYSVGSGATTGGGQVSITSAGLVTYRPPAGYRGTDSFTYTATNPGGTSNPATVSVPVGDPTLNATVGGSGAKAGVALSGYTIIGSGGRAAYACATDLVSGALPAGVSLNTDCSLSGTPTQGGPFSFAVRLTDNSTGTGPFSQTVSGLGFSVQAATPTVAITAPANGSTTSSYDVTVSGTATDASSVTVTFQSVAYGPIAVSGGSWTQDLPRALANGTYTVAAVATNGQEASVPANSTFTVAVASPAAPAITAPTAGQRLTTVTPTVSGTAPRDSAVVVREGGAVIATATANGAGMWSTVSNTLDQGAHSITATARDIAGNTSVASSAVVFTIDTFAPVAPLVTAPAQGSNTSNTTPTYAGVAEADAIVEVLVDGNAIGTTTADGAGNWSTVQPSALALGGHTIRATARDAAGNVSPASATVSFSVVAPTPAPAVTELTPTSGPSTGGTSVTVSGADFVAGSTSVTIGGTTVPASSVTVISPTSLSIVTPAHAAGVVGVVVSTPNGASGAAPGGFTYVAAPSAPSIVGLSPTQGPASGGTLVTLSGLGFTGASSVTFGGVPAQSFTIDSDTRITAMTPPGSGVANVVVTTPAGSSVDTAADDFTYVGSGPPIAAVPTMTEWGLAILALLAGLLGVSRVRRLSLP